MARVQDGDVIYLDSHLGKLDILVDEKVFNSRPIIHPDLSANEVGMGRELLDNFRQFVSSADLGATVI